MENIYSIHLNIAKITIVPIDIVYSARTEQYMYIIATHSELYTAAQNKFSKLWADSRNSEKFAPWENNLTYGNICKIIYICSI